VVDVSCCLQLLFTGLLRVFTGLLNVFTSVLGVFTGLLNAFTGVLGVFIGVLNVFLVCSPVFDIVIVHTCRWILSACVCVCVFSNIVFLNLRSFETL